MSKTVLILGASGRFGAAAQTAFTAAGWDVRGFVRGRDQLENAVRDVDVVVNAWNPPDYTTWARDMLAMHLRVMQALRGSEATVILPGNVYVFGAQTPGPWGTTSRHAAENPLGRLRIDMEQAYRDSGLRTIVLRCGDFLDTKASGNWFDLIMIKSLAKGRFVYPGDLDTPHAWAFLPDAARAAVELAEKRHDLPRFADIPFTGYTATGREIAESLSRVMNRPVRAKTMGWAPLRLLAPFVKSFRGLIEMRYLWNTPHSLEDTQMRQWLPDFQATPLDTALMQATAHLDLGVSVPKGAVRFA